MSPYVSIILACYNEAEHLENSVAEIETTLSELRHPVELIFIDDASTDETPDILRRIGMAHPEYRIVYHTKNVGRGGTVAEGIRMAGAAIAGYFDVDLEISPCYVLSVLTAFASGNCDIAVGSRVYKIHSSPFVLSRHLTHRVYRALVHRLLPVPVSDSEAGFKFFDRKGILPILDRVEDQKWFWDTEIMILAGKAGLRIKQFTCLYERNLTKTSTVRLIPDTIEYIRQIRRMRSKLKREPVTLPAGFATVDNPGLGEKRE